MPKLLRAGSASLHAGGLDASCPSGAHAFQSALQVSEPPQSLSEVHDFMHISGAVMLGAQTAPGPHGHTAVQ